jgi:23S rRNA (cytidine1920-2'-O)/16S rRNA (cytidine1409-2'-O)-methyltransferase
MAERIRLDVLLVERGLAESRQRAAALILAGEVRVEGRKASKAGQRVAPDVEVEVLDPGEGYVSRGGFKLASALDTFSLQVTGLVAMDVGASTGGFTDCLLRRGAQKVYAIDVGYGQLAWQLRQDSRVVVLERCNVRYLNHEQVPESVDLAVIDTSFISLKKVIPKVLEFLKSSGQLLALIKPQFEVDESRWAREELCVIPRCISRWWESWKISVEVRDWRSRGLRSQASWAPKETVSSSSTL